MEYKTIILSKRDRISILTLNRPDRLNAFNTEMEREIAEALNEVDNDDGSRVLVITGAGQAFCAGADVRSIPDRNGTDTSAESAMISPGEAARRRLSRSSGIILPKLQKMVKPTIAMVNGVALGGGCDFAFGCDLRTGSENTRFMSAFIRVGLFLRLGWHLAFPKDNGGRESPGIPVYRGLYRGKGSQKIGNLEQTCARREPA